MTINATTQMMTGEKSTNISIMPAPTAGAYLWLFNRPQMLDHKLDLAILEVRYRSARILRICSGYHTRIAAAHGPLCCDDIAVYAARRTPEEAVALTADDLVGGFVEYLEGGTVHPNNGVLGIVYYYKVVYLVQYHVEQNVGESLLFHFSHRMQITLGVLNLAGWKNLKIGTSDAEYVDILYVTHDFLQEL